MNIIESMHDKAVFRKSFEDLKTWGVWQVYLKALFGLPMTKPEARKYKKHTGNKYKSGRVSQISYVLSGRRSGKSKISALLACYLATYRDWSKILSPGEEGYIFLVANDKSQALILKRYVSGILQQSSKLRGWIKKELTWEIELKNRITIAVRTKDFRTLRGYTVIAAILEELAFWRSEESANPDLEVLAAVRPAMLTVKDSVLIGISSAYAKRGLLYNEYKEHYGKASGPLIWKSSTVDMNPTVDKKAIAEQIKSDPAKYKSEYLSEFRGDIESYLGTDDISKIIDPGIFQRPYNPQYKYFAFCDPSGGRVDSMTLSIAHKDRTGGIIQDVLNERKPPFQPSEVVSEFVEILTGYGITRISSDRYAGAWIEESFKKHGISVEYSKLSASEIYAAFIPIVMNKAAALLDNRRLKSQLSNLERRTGQSGREIITHPAGSHDDLANAAAGVITLFDRGPRKIARGWRVGSKIVEAIDRSLDCRFAKLGRLSDEKLIQKFKKMPADARVELYKKLEADVGLRIDPENYKPHQIVRCFMILMTSWRAREARPKPGPPMRAATEEEMLQIWGDAIGRSGGSRISEPGARISK